MNTNKLGLDPMLVEACTFAWLGKMRLEKKKINLKHSTGANPSTLGEIF
jgi:1,6-anhydro-N-acetylmuramate kinase